MPGQSRHFFELAATSALSKALRRRETGGFPVPPPVASPPEPAPVHRETSFPTFETPAVQYTEELWHALLAWIAEALGSKGTFAMDERGFPIARSGELGSAPPEVLLAAFTSVGQLLETYLGEERPVRALVVSAREEPDVVLMTFDWIGESILIGSIGGRIPTAAEAERIASTIQEQLQRIAGSQAPGES